VHVLIGPNGVGKTFLLRQMARALVEEEVHESGAGRFIPATNTPEADGFFSNLVSLTFSAFDPFDSFRERRDRSVGIRYTYVGLQRPSARKTKVGPEGAPRIGAPKSLRVLTTSSLRVCGNARRVLGMTGGGGRYSFWNQTPCFGKPRSRLS